MFGAQWGVRAWGTTYGDDANYVKRYSQLYPLIRVELRVSCNSPTRVSCTASLKQRLVGAFVGHRDEVTVQFGEQHIRATWIHMHRTAGVCTIREAILGAW